MLRERRESLEHHFEGMEHQARFFKTFFGEETSFEELGLKFKNLVERYIVYSGCVVVGSGARFKLFF